MRALPAAATAFCTQRRATRSAFLLFRRRSHPLHAVMPLRWKVARMGSLVSAVGHWRRGRGSCIGREADSAIAILRSGAFGCGLPALVMRSTSPVMGLTWGIICTPTQARSVVQVHDHACVSCWCVFASRAGDISGPFESSEVILGVLGAPLQCNIRWNRF